MKNPFYYPLGLLFLFVFHPVQAQLDTFDLSKYKLPEIKRKQLDFNFNGTLQQQKNSADGYSSFTGNGDFSPALSTFTNKENYQGEGNLNLNLQPTFSNYSYSSSSNINEDKSKDAQITLQLNSINRFYFKDKLFFETDLNGYLNNYTYSREYRYIDQNINNDNAQFQGNASVSVLFGKGRIEPVEDARLALYILQDLQKLNKLTRVPTNEEILEFSALISQIKNKRFFDSRLHKIAELTEVDHFLNAKGLVKDNDIAYFNAVNDNWDYSSGPARSAGSRLYIGIQPTFNLGNNLSHSYTFDNSMVLTQYLKTQTSTQDVQLGYITGYLCDKPLNLYWQVNYGGSILYTSDFVNDKDQVLNSTNKSREGTFMPHEFASLGYYPNSRTFFEAGVGFSQAFSSFRNWSGSNSWVDGGKEYGYSGSFNLSFYYYISPQLRFNGGWNLNAIFTDDKRISSKTHYINQNLNCGLIYSLF